MNAWDLGKAVKRYDESLKRWAKGDLGRPWNVAGFNGHIPEDILLAAGLIAPGARSITRRKTAQRMKDLANYYKFWLWSLHEEKYRNAERVKPLWWNEETGEFAPYSHANPWNQ